MARMPSRGFSPPAGKAARVIGPSTGGLTISSPDLFELTDTYFRALKLKEKGLTAVQIVRALDLPQSYVPRIESILPFPGKGKPNEGLDDNSVKKRYAKSTQGEGLRIVETPKEVAATPASDAERREIAARELERISAEHQAAQLKATQAVAAKLTPLLNEYIALSDQTTVEGQREICERIRSLCHANDLAVKCPKTGLESLVFAAPRPERKTPLRVVFRIGTHETHADSRLHHVELLPAISLVAGRTNRLAARGTGNRKVAQ